MIDLYSSEGKDIVLRYLSIVEFKYSPDLNNTWYIYNEGYNDEVNRYNALLEQFIAYVKLSNDRRFASQLLTYIKPILIENEKCDKMELSYQPQKDIKKRLGL